MLLNRRVRKIRKDLGLNQTEFGRRLGVTTAAISKIESGERGLTEQMLLAICREFGINETWLRTGEGNMFKRTIDDLITQLSVQYNLDALDCKILKIYINLPKDHRQLFKDAVSKLLEAANNEITATLENDEIDKLAIERNCAIDIINAQASIDNIHNASLKKEKLSY